MHAFVKLPRMKCLWAGLRNHKSRTDPRRIRTISIPIPIPIPIRACPFPISILPCSFLDLDVTALRPVRGRDCHGAIVKETSSWCLIYAAPWLGVVFPTQQP